MLPLRLPSQLSPLRCRCTAHYRPSPLLLRRRCTISLLPLPLLLLLLLPPPPPPAFAGPFVSWLLRCCPPSNLVIPCCHVTVNALIAGLLCMLHHLKYFGTCFGYFPTSQTVTTSKIFQDTKYSGISMFLLRNSLELVLHHTCSCSTWMKITFRLD